MSEYGKLQFAGANGRRPSFQLKLLNPCYGMTSIENLCGFTCYVKEAELLQDGQGDWKVSKRK